MCVDDETLILIIQVVTLVLVAIQSIPQIMLLHKQKEKVVKNLSLASWVYKTGFSVFFVISLFAGETNPLIVATQIINLTMSAIIMTQIAYYSHLKVVPQPINPFVILGELEEHEIMHTKEVAIPVLHNLLKQIYVIGNFNLIPKLL